MTVTQIRRRDEDVIERTAVVDGGAEAPSVSPGEPEPGAGARATSDALYVVGHTAEERQRLIKQAAILRPLTERFLRDAGIGPAMRVLDLGCGVGDVSLLLAELVGPTGAVIGVDKDPRALALAGERANGHANVSFVEGDLREVSFDEPFDAAFGRLVLVYLGDPAAAIRSVARQVRPDGIVGFQDYDFSTWPPPTWPRIPLWDRAIGWLGETIRQAGLEMQMGLKYRRAFLAAGLPAPAVHMDVLVGSGADVVFPRYLANTTRSMLPMIERFGIATAAEVEVETLAERLHAAAVAVDATITLPPLAGAWTRTPAA
jgi:ubiquinone/menaquinone biosynthesis C-methylase UbiE